MKTAYLVAVLVALLTHQLLAGGAVSINWANDGTLVGPSSPFYADAAGTTLLSAGNASTAGDGYRVDLIALQGGTNYVLATISVGDTPTAVTPSADGFFDTVTAVSSNILAGAVGAPLGVRFFNATTIGAATKVGIVSNATITVPTPDWATPPFPMYFAPDSTDSTYQGPRTAGNTGFYTDTSTGVVLTNQTPIAICHDVTISAVANCQASVTANQINNGSSDPDGDPLTFSLSSNGPFELGTNSITLIVADNHGGTNTCQANVIVNDTTAPSISCPNSILVQIPAGQTSAIVNFSDPVTSDNCGVQSISVVPPSGAIFQLGTTPVVCSVTDTANHTNTCGFNVTIATQASTNASDHVGSLQQDVTSLRQCLGEVGLLLLAHNQAGAAVHLNTCIATGSLLLSNAQAQATSTALSAKTAAKLAKKIAAWVAKLNTALPADEAKALKSILKLTGTGIKLEQLFLKLGDVYPVLVVTEVSGKTGYHGTNEVVCYHVNVLNGGGLTNCNPVTITISNFPSSFGLDVVQGPTIYSNRVDLCVTTGSDQGGAVITATGCEQSSSVVLINTGN